MSNLTRALMIACALLGSMAIPASAAVVNGTNWADSVGAYSGNIQNYGGTMMSSGTEFWLTGEPDADADENGYAWDVGDPDYVGGWRASAPSEFIVMEWNLGIPDLVGDDLTIRRYGGPSASANVLASVDGTSFTPIGTIGGGTPGYLTDATFDFAGLFADDVQYVRVERIGNGPQTGMFFDAFGGIVPEPATLSLLGIGAVALLRHRKHK